MSHAIEVNNVDTLYRRCCPHLGGHEAARGTALLTSTLALSEKGIKPTVESTHNIDSRAVAPLGPTI